jgi:hypothetical protein
MTVSGLGYGNFCTVWIWSYFCTIYVSISALYGTTINKPYTLQNIVSLLIAIEARVLGMVQDLRFGVLSLY